MLGYMRKIGVHLGEHSYEIQIGGRALEAMEAFVRSSGFSKKALVVSDAAVGKIYGKKILASLGKAGLEAQIYIVAPGEPSKSLAAAEGIYTEAIRRGLDRNAAIFALGGGVVGDLTGFVAATYLRGVPFIQIPTSLLAQVDSSVGGKVAVNHPLGKNLIGAFYQPRAVFIDPAMLQSLPEREIYTGLAEVVKYGLIDDGAFFEELERGAERILHLDLDAMADIIARSCEIKAKVVGQDEKETGLRMILNFGHTIAHAIESDTGYARYNHGEAVAIGMYGAAILSRSLGLLASDEVERILASLQRFRLPWRTAECSAEGLFQLLSRDKKTVDGDVRWVLLETIGKCRIEKGVPQAAVMKALEEVALKR